MNAPLLNPAFRVDWQSNSKDLTDEILQILRKICSPIRNSGKFATKGRQRRRGTKKEKSDVLIGESGSEIKNQSMPKAVEPTILEAVAKSVIVEDSEKNSDFKSISIIGISNILRHLEKKDLEIALFDRSILRPSAVAHFIGSACIASGAHCVCIENLGDQLAPILNLKSASALAIRKSVDKRPDPIRDLVNAILTMKPVIRVANENEEAKKKKRKRTTDHQIAVDSYVDSSVLIRKNAKKKRK